jgi:hypothetical protein
VLGAALAGWATILPISMPHWPVLVASSAAPEPASLPSASAPLAESVEVPVPADAPVAVTAAAEMPATGTSLPPAAGIEAAIATEPSKPVLDDRARPRTQTPPARSRRSASSVVARAAPAESTRHRPVVLQLSSYADQARARQAAETLHRSLQKILKGAAVRTEEAEVHGRRLWRVVAGPVADRDRGRRLCDAVHHAGQSCVVMLL